MSDNNTTGMFINFVMSMLLKKIIVPTDYHDQVQVVKDMLKDDISGLIDSLTDFAVDAASVDYSIETDNVEFTKKLKNWADNINSSYNGKVPRGIKALAKEYFKERWKSSSFPILKITKWEVIDKITVPTRMFFVDGGSVYAENTSKEGEINSLEDYGYSLGKSKKDKLDKGVIITKPFGRWFDVYPTPYLIKRGIFHNWKIIQSLKNKQSELLDQIIPYIFLVKKGSEALARENIKTYTQTELQEVVNQFKDMMNEFKSNTSSSAGAIKTPIRATNFDEELKHFIPDISSLFNRDLFVTAERNILSGLGFIDVIEATSSTRRESILNPKAFIKETQAGVEDFKGILNELVSLIIENNKEHRKYVNTNFYICSSPVVGFMTDDFKSMARSLYDRGILSKQTATELIGEVCFKTETHRRKKETEQGLDLELYPPVIMNREGEGIDLKEDYGEPKETPEKETEEETPDDKKGIEKENFNQSKLVGSPYETIKDLPSRVKDNLDIDLQRVFMRVFNNAYNTYQNETRAFRVAWSVIRQLGRKGKDGKWQRKKKRVNGRLEQIKLSKSMIEKALEKEEKQAIEEAMELKELEIKEKQSKLLDKLLSNKREEK